MGTTTTAGRPGSRPARRARVRGLAACAVAALALGANCGREDRMISGPSHSGWRADVPESDRGNATFEEAWWSDDGAWLVTRHQLQSGLRVFDAEGRLQAVIDAHRVESVPMIDGARRRYVGRVSNDRGLEDRSRLVVCDLLGGAIVAEIPDDPAQPCAPLGLTDGGASVVLAKPGAIEVWRLEPPALLRSAPSPLPRERHAPANAVIPATYHDRNGWEISARGSWLALARYDGAAAPKWTWFLVDLHAMTVEELQLPGEAGAPWFTCFAISADERRLALGTSAGVWLRDLATGEWERFLPGDHKRNDDLGPMRFSADGERLVALGDQLQVSVFEAATGRLLGRREPDFEDWEGIFRVARDGSRVVLYHFTSDTLEVLDGRDARRIGWICPYFCNARHNPVAVAYAVSPDGRRVAASHRLGAAIWETDTDRLVAPLRDASLPALRPR